MFEFTSQLLCQVDIPFLAYAGHDVVGVEMIEQPILELEAENNLILVKQPQLLPGKNGTFTMFSGGRRDERGSIIMLQGNFFDMTAAVVGQFERVWDR